MASTRATFFRRPGQVGRITPTALSAVYPAQRLSALRPDWRLEVRLLSSSGTYQGNNLTITKALLNVIADAKTKVYGDADPSLTYQVSGLKKPRQDVSSALPKTPNRMRFEGRTTGQDGRAGGGLNDEASSATADNRTRLFALRPGGPASRRAHNANGVIRRYRHFRRRRSHSAAPW